MTITAVAIALAVGLIYLALTGLTLIVGRRGALDTFTTSTYTLLLFVVFCIVALDLREASASSSISLWLSATATIMSAVALLACITTAKLSPRTPFPFVIVIHNMILSAALYAELMKDNVISEAQLASETPFGTLEWTSTAGVLWLLWGVAVAALLVVTVMYGLYRLFTPAIETKTMAPKQRSHSRAQHKPATLPRRTKRPVQLQPQAPVRAFEYPGPWTGISYPEPTQVSETHMLPDDIAVEFSLPELTQASPKPTTPPEPLKRHARGVKHSPSPTVSASPDSKPRRGGTRRKPKSIARAEKKRIKQERKRTGAPKRERERGAHRDIDVTKL